MKTFSLVTMSLKILNFSLQKILMVYSMETQNSTIKSRTLFIFKEGSNFPTGYLPKLTKNPEIVTMLISNSKCRFSKYLTRTFFF